MRNLLLVFILLLSISVFGQVNGTSFEPNGALAKKRLLNVSIKKYGPYFGLQKGKYLVPEVGVEGQYKKIRLSKTVTHAAHMGFNYNLKHNVLGYDVGYWNKPHRIGLTYGANLFLRTDFDRTKLGIAPVIGFKFWLLHFQTGYHFMTRPEPTDIFRTNKFFVSLRVGIINERDVDIKRRK